MRVVEYELQDTSYRPVYVFTCLRVYPCTLAFQCDLPKILAVPQTLLGGGGVFEREGFVENGLEFARHDQIHDSGEIL